MKQFSRYLFQRKHGDVISISKLVPVVAETTAFRQKHSGMSTELKPMVSAKWEMFFEKVISSLIGINFL